MDFFSFDASWIYSVLPLDPFKDFIVEFFEVGLSADVLHWLNWFIPVGDFVKITAAWVGCVMLYYIYTVVLRWLRVIE